MSSSMAIAFPFSGTIVVLKAKRPFMESDPDSTVQRRIIFITATQSFSIADVSFVSVVKGKWVAASMIADSQQVANHVA